MTIQRICDKCGRQIIPGDHPTTNLTIDNVKTSDDVVMLIREYCSGCTKEIADFLGMGWHLERER